MALLFIESFDKMTESLLQTDVRWTYANLQYINTSYGRWGTIGVNCRYNSQRLSKRNFPSETYTTMVIGYALRITERVIPSLNSSYPFFYFTEGGIVHLSFYVNNIYQLQVRRGTSEILQTSTAAMIKPYTWLFIEIKATIHDTTGSYEVRINEETFLSQSGIDTQNGGNGYIDGINLKHVHDLITNWDDVYVDSSTFHGDCRIQGYTPTADGSTHNDFTPLSGNRFENVDDAVGHDSDTTYVSSDTLNHKQTFEYTMNTLGTVKAVQATVVSRKDDAGLIGMKNLCVSNSSDYLDTNEYQHDPLYFLYHSTIYEVDPDDSNVWTLAKIEAAEFGAQITDIV